MNGRDKRSKAAVKLYGSPKERFDESFVNKTTKPIISVMR